MLFKFKDSRSYSINRRFLFIIVLFILWVFYRYYDGIYFTDYFLDSPKYILNWKSNVLSRVPCQYSCILTDNRNLLGDYRRFDAIIFSQYELNTPLGDRPQERTASQIYVFFSVESASNFPACEVYNDNFFNWTFTYRLDSDIPCRYFLVQNLSGTVVAPNLNVNWLKNTLPIRPEIKAILQQKTKAAAWIVSNCKSDSLRNDYVSLLQESLFHFSLQIDVYGECSKTKCRGTCEEMLAREYYFYIAFENSFADDYVTEKVLHGYNNYVVPIVYGAANYSRFLPTGSYVNARDYHPYNLAFLIKEAMTDHSKYEQYFKWTNSYTITDQPPVHNPLCDLCEALHSDKAKHAPAHENFRLWWNKRSGMKWCLPEEYWNETSLSNIDGKHMFTLY